MQYDHRVPPELFQPIIQSICPRADLLSMALCCKDFVVDAQKQLFKNPFTGEDSAGAHCRFLETIIASPDRLALYVKSYCQVTPQFARTAISQHQRANNNYEDLMKKTALGLPMMKNLRHLEYRPFVAAVSVAAGNILARCRFPHLESLEWWCEGAEVYLVTKVFPHHPRIKHLGAMWMRVTHPNAIVPAFILRDLESVCGTGGVFTAFMPGRRVTRLPCKRRLGHLKKTILDGENLTEELSRVRYLAYDFPGPEMAVTLRMVPNLEELELIITSSGNARSQLKQLRLLERLTSLVLTARDGFPVEEFLLEETHRKLAGIAFAQSATLRFVDIDSGHGVYSRYRGVRRRHVDGRIAILLAKVGV